MNSFPAHCFRLGFIIAALAFIENHAAMAQTANDPTAAEVRLLRSTNDRLAKENDALKAELATLKKKLAEGETTTRPAALSAGSDAPGAPRKIVFILDGSGSMLNVFDRAREE